MSPTGLSGDSQASCGFVCFNSKSKQRETRVFQTKACALKGETGSVWASPWYAGEPCERGTLKNVPMTGQWLPCQGPLGRRLQLHILKTRVQGWELIKDQTWRPQYYFFKQVTHSIVSKPENTQRAIAGQRELSLTRQSSRS